MHYAGLLFVLTMIVSDACEFKYDHTGHQPPKTLKCNGQPILQRTLLFDHKLIYIECLDNNIENYDEFVDYAKRLWTGLPIIFTHFMIRGCQMEKYGKLIQPHLNVTSLEIAQKEYSRGNITDFAQIMTIFPNLQILKLENTEVNETSWIVVPQVKDLDVYGSKKTGLFSNLAMTKSIQHLKVRGWQNLNSLSGIKKYPELKTFKVLNCPSLESLPAYLFAQNKFLEELSLEGIPFLTVNPNSLRGLSNLNKLWIRQTPFKTLPDGFFAHTPHLTEFNWQDDNANIENLSCDHFKSLKHLVYGNAKRNFHFDLGPETFAACQDSLVQLTISNSGLTHLDFLQPLKNLEFLDVHLNDISEISEKDLPNTLQELRISGNPLKCDCQTADTIVSWQQRMVIYNYHWLELHNCPDQKYTAQNFWLHKHCELELKSTAIWAKVKTIFIVLIVAAILAVATFGLFKIRREICLAYLTTKALFNKPNEEEMEFDVYISSYDDDDEIKESMYFHLKDGFPNRNFDVAISDKNFYPGLTLRQNARDCIDKSYFIVVLLTANYLDDKFCKDELIMIIQKEVVSRQRHLIVIVFDHERMAEFKNEAGNEYIRWFLDIYSVAHSLCLGNIILDPFGPVFKRFFSHY